MNHKVIEELRFSVGIVLSREELAPRFRVICPEGDWTLFVPLPDDIGERQRRMQLLYAFMGWRSARERPTCGVRCARITCAQFCARATQSLD